MEVTHIFTRKEARYNRLKKKKLVITKKWVLWERITGDIST